MKRILRPPTWYGQPTRSRPSPGGPSRALPGQAWPLVPDLDAEAAGFVDIFGVVLLLPSLAWCLDCDAAMQVWAGIPHGAIYRCPLGDVRATHNVPAHLADHTTWTTFTRGIGKKHRRLTDPAARRTTLTNAVTRVRLRPEAFATEPVTDLITRRPHH